MYGNTNFPILTVIARKTGKGPTGAQSYSGTDPGAFSIFTAEAPGLKVSPKTVLITSLVYVGIVVFLHIWSKMMSGGGTLEGEVPTDL